MSNPESDRNEAGWGTPAEARHLVDFHARYGTEPAERVLHDRFCRFAGGGMCYRLECSTLDFIRAALVTERAIGAETDVERLRMQVLRLGGVLDGFAHGVGTRSSKPSDPDDVRWECLCGIGGSPQRVERHWLAELRDSPPLATPQPGAPIDE